MNESYQFTYNGYTLLNDDNRVISKVDGLSRVDVRVFEDNTTGADGGNIWERKYAMRTIVLGGQLFGVGDTPEEELTDYFEQRGLFENAFVLNPSSFELAILLPDGRQRFINAKVVDVPEFLETPGESAQCNFQVVLKCEDPFFTDGVVNEVEIHPGIEGGTPVPMPVPSPIGGVGETATIINTGDPDITNYAEFLIYGQITNPTVTNQSTGLTFAVNTTLNLGDIVDVYIQNNDLYVMRGSSNYMQYFSGDFFPIAVGTNAIVFNGVNFDANSKLVIRFTNKYLGVS